MKSTIRLVLALAAVIAIVGVAQAIAADQPADSAKTAAVKSTGVKGGIETGTAEEGNFGIVQKLGLTEQQTEKIKGILEGSKAQRQTAMAARVEAAKKLTQLAISGASEADITAAATELGKAAGNHAIQVSQTWGQVKGVLTPEQQTKLQELIKERQDQRAERRAEIKEKAQERRKGATSGSTDGSTTK